MRNRRRMKEERTEEVTEEERRVGKDGTRWDFIGYNPISMTDMIYCLKESNDRC